VTGVTLALLSADAFLYLYALPVTTYLVTSGLHTIFAHGNNIPEGSRTSARNVWLLEFIIPMAGEWIHKEHHDQPKLYKFNTRPYYFDLGGTMIGIIEKHDKSTA
jgi:fatty-acid desaturase